MAFNFHPNRRRPFARLRCVPLDERIVPATFNIADGDVAGLVAAIAAANTNGEPDTITLAPAGTYTFTTRADDAAGGTALPVIGLDIDPTSGVTINGNGATVQRSAAPGTPGFRFLSANGANVTVDNLTITGFDAQVPTDLTTPAGGAIFVNGADLHVSGCTITGNAAATAGAIADTGGPAQTFTMDQCTVTNNVGGAAAIDVSGPGVSVTNSTIAGNSADGIDVAGQASLFKTTVAGNAGTGVSVQGSLTLLDTTVSGNGLTGAPIVGGVNVVGDGSIPSGLSVTDSTIDGNQGLLVGGISIDAGASATFSSNVGHATVTDNQTVGAGGAAGGIWVSPGTPPFAAHIGGTIVAGNTSASAPDLGGTYDLLGYDFVGNGDGGTNVGFTTGNLVGTTAAPLDPLLGPLQNNGGTTLTREPLPGSPVINAGDPSFFPPPDFDERGAPRVRDGLVDIGAVEAPPPPVDLSVTITDGQTSIGAGGHSTYTVVVQNVGTIDAAAAPFTLAAPTDTTLTWTSTAGGGATGNTNGGGPIGDSLTLPVGSSVTYTVTAKLAITATGTLTMTAAIAPPADTPDSNTANNTASDTDTIVPHVPLLAAGTGAGTAPLVHVYDAVTGALERTIAAYDPGFRGGVRVATADLNGDGTDDIITAAGPGGGPHIRIFDGKTGAMMSEFFAYGAGFHGGVFVAAGDVNGDGVPDIITGAGAGGGPHIRVFDGVTHAVIREFFAYDAGFHGGVSVAAADVDGDGLADIITGAGPGGGPHVKVFSGADNHELYSFFAYSAGFTGGVFVAAGDTNGDGRAEIITGAGAGGGPHVRVFDGATGAVDTEFFAYGTFSGGVHVAAVDADGDGLADIETGPGAGGGPHVRMIHPATLAELHGFFAFDPSNLSGVFVG
jgi:hypothetical protein